MLSKFANKNRISKEETAELFKQLNSGDFSAREKIINGNLNFAAYIARCYLNKGIEYNDLVQLAIIGLTKAVDTFNPQNKNNATFSSYACVVMKNEIGMELRKLKARGNIINYSDIFPNSSFYITIMDEYIDATMFQNTELTDETISSLDALTREKSVVQLHKIIEKVLSHREQKIIKLYFGLGELSDLNYDYFYSESFGTNEQQFNQREIAKMLNCSHVTVFRVLKSALQKIKNELEKEQNNGLFEK